MSNWVNKTHVGDCRTILAAMSEASVTVNTCITSPPYFGLRDYGHADQIGLEPTPEDYIARLVQVFAAVRNVLADDGTLWLNLGDSYGAARQLLGIPWRVAFALQADGWYLRSDIIWHKPNAMPESVTDRPTKAHEYMFLLAKSDRYYYDQEAIAEASTDRNPGNVSHKYTDAYRVGGDDKHRTKAGLVAYSQRKQSALGRKLTASALGTNEAHQTRNRRTVWSVSTNAQPEAHFACFPPALIEPCILAGAAPGGIVLDPFMGSGTTARVALSLGRQFIGCELNPAYVGIQDKIGLQAGMAI